MPKLTVDFDEEEDNIIDIFKSTHKLKNKKESIRKMIRVAFKHSKAEIHKIVDDVSTKKENNQ